MNGLSKNSVELLLKFVISHLLFHIQTVHLRVKNVIVVCVKKTNFIFLGHKVHSISELDELQKTQRETERAISMDVSSVFDTK